MNAGRTSGSLTGGSAKLAFSSSTRDGKAADAGDTAYYDEDDFEAEAADGAAASARYPGAKPRGHGAAVSRDSDYGEYYSACKASPGFRSIHAASLIHRLFYS